MFRVMQLSDIHIGHENENSKGLDNKANIGGISSNRENDLFKSIEKYLTNLNQQEKIDIFALSGDIIVGGNNEGQKRFSERFIKLIKKYGYEEKQILVVPGNHDIERYSKISSKERYKSFLDAWKGCMLPYLDGSYKVTDIVIDKEKKIILIPINTANWSQILSEEYDNIQEKIEDLDKNTKNLIKKQFAYDAAYISDEQLEEIKKELEKIDDVETYVKIIIQHHHITPVNDDKHLEIKSLGDLINIQKLEQLIIDFNISTVIHGHKHINNDFYTYLTNNNNPHQVLVASSSDTKNEEIFKIFEFKYLKVNIKNYDKNLKESSSKTFSLFNNIESETSVILESNSITRLFGKIQSYFAMNNNSKLKKQMICTINLEKHYKNKIPIRKLYKHSDKQEIFEDAVKRYANLWLQDSSLYEKEIPIHGIRLKKYKGYFNQIEYMQSMIKYPNSKSRAIAVLLNPVKDFQIISDENKRTDYPSFVSCQVTVREKGNEKFLDIIANYRSQEMHYWWQLNIAELYQILNDIKKGLDSSYYLGKITTITALPSFAKKEAFGRAYVSLIDYYADCKENTEKLPHLAHSIVCNKKPNQYIIEEYNKIFKDLLEFTNITSNEDGNSRLRDGIKLFNKHLKKACENMKIYQSFFQSMKILEEKIHIFNLHDKAKESEMYEDDMKNITDSIKNAQQEFKNLLSELEKNETKTNISL